MRTYFSTLSRLKKSIALILLGLCVVAALPPFHVVPLAFIGMGGFFLFLDQTATKKQAFLTGWLFGIGFFGGGLYWLTNAFLVNADKHAWMIPIAVPLLAAAMGLFIGVTALLTVLVWRKARADQFVLGRVLLFINIWTLMEWVRGWLFTGFPWNLIGTIWGFHDAMIQPAAWVGAYGLSLITVLALTVWIIWFYDRRFKKIAMLAVIIPALMFTAGSVRLNSAQTETYDHLVLRLIQPNIVQKDKWAKDKRLDNFQKHLNLSTRAPLTAGQRPNYIIWPETAVTYPMNRDERVMKIVGSVAPSGGGVITGTPRMTPIGEHPFQVWNSLVAVNEVGQLLGGYDKFHLVPFGEYMPFRDLIPLKKLTAGSKDFSAGPGLQTLNLPGLPPFSPLICYEIIFPDNVANQNQRPAWLLNLTNDGWYGDSPGPYQHLMSARMRSIEEGLSLVRVANTGISVVTDAYGRVLQRLPYGVEGVLDFALPKPLEQPPLAAQVKSVGWGSLLVICFILGQLLLARQPNDKS